MAMHPVPRRLSLLTLVLLAASGSLYSQATPADTDSPKKAAVNLYIDGPYSQSDYFRTEIKAAFFVRDRNQADIHILTTSERTGGGGRKYTVEFIGLGRFSSLSDTLYYYSKLSDSEDDVRAGLVRTVNMGLVRYVARTPHAKNLSIGYTAPGKTEQRIDKWNRWVFSVGSSFSTNGQKSSRSLNVRADVEARRVTEELRLSFEMYGNYNEDRFEYDDETTLDLSTSKGAEALAAWSLGEHWSVGGIAEISASTYSNKRADVTLGSALEYNYYPYSESTRRQLRFMYFALLNYVDYEKKTLFDKHNEWLYKEELEITLEMTEPWGEANMSLSGSHYFHDVTKYRLRLSGDLSMNLTEGFSFDIYASTSRIHDQLNLPKSGLSKEDVLLRRTELATDYDYSISFGFSYSFGSIYNDAVNPRFGL